MSHELARMGANISVLDDRIIYDAPNELTGSCVQATDLRAGAGFGYCWNYCQWNYKNL